jgi:hypothetical protein
VTSIPDEGFKDCEATSIYIPDTVTSIGQKAFWGCSNLTSLRLSENFTTIKYAFIYECTSLKSLDIPSSVTTIEYMAFLSAHIESIRIPASVTSIADQTFYCGPIKIVYLDGCPVSVARSQTMLYNNTEFVYSTIKITADGFTEVESDLEGYYKYTETLFQMGYGSND